MKPPSIRCAVVLALLLATSAGAGERGINLGGFIGAGYLLGTDPSSNGFGLGTSSLDLMAGVRASGGGLRPELLTWAGNLTWMGMRTFNLHNQSALTNFGFGASLQAAKGSFLPVTFDASRTFNDASTGAAGSAQVGTSATTSLGGSVTYGQAVGPRLTASLSRVMIDTIPVAGAQSTFSGNTRLLAGVSQSLNGFSYSGAYDTNWSGGTFAQQGYRSHLVNARADGPVGDTVSLFATDQYYLRKPTNDSPLNPRMDTNVFGGGVRWLPSNVLTATFAVNHNESLVASPAQADLVTRNQSLTQSLLYRWSERVALTQSLGVQSGYARSGVGEAGGIGESVGAGARWNSPLAYGSAGVTGDATVGLVQPIAGAAQQLQWGAGGSLFTTVDGQRMTAFGSYTLSYAQGGAGITGDSLSQELKAQATVRPRDGLTLRGSLVGSGRKRQDAILGTFFNRTITLLLEAGLGRHHGMLTAGLFDGLDAATGTGPAPGSPSDGLFLPVAYNAHTRYVGAGWSSVFLSGKLPVNLTARVSQTEFVNQAATTGGGVTLQAQYLIGKFRVSLEDRLSFTTAANEVFNQNVLMLRLTRDFGMEF